MRARIASSTVGTATSAKPVSILKNSKLKEATSKDMPMLPMNKSSAMRAPEPIDETGFGAGPVKRHVEISQEQEVRLTTEEISEGIK